MSEPHGPISDSAYLVTEGGPFLIGDLSVVGAWRGAFGDGQDYLEAVAAVERSSGSSTLAPFRGGVLWDVPTGSVRFARDRDGSLVLKAPRRAGSPPTGAPRLPIAVASGWLIVIWAAEDGLPLGSTSLQDGTAIDLSIGHAAAAFRGQPGPREVRMMVEHRGAGEVVDVVRVVGVSGAAHEDRNQHGP